ncbi:MAG: hypothetical protein H6807_03985 [Planctomycetes bacterium]|nr:hypothetical protein [Planctomycetota bacterium]
MPLSLSSPRRRGPGVPAADRRLAPRAGLLFMVFTLLALLGPRLPAQEEKPKEERAARLIAELRAGRWELKTVEQLVRALVQAREEHAARWWTAMAITAAERGELPAETGKKLEQLAKVEGLKPHEPSLRAMPVRAIKHLETLMKARAYTGAPEAIHFARRCLETYPDAKLVAEVDAIEKSLETVDRKEEKPLSAVLTKSLQRLVGQLGEARDALLADMLAQYERHPCPPGARATRALILARGEAEVSSEWRQAFDRLAEIEHAVEPTLTLRVWVENGGKVSVWRDGKRLLGGHGRSSVGEVRDRGASFAVIAGDLIQFEIEKLHAKKAGRKLFVVALAAELEGKPLGAEAWFRNANGRVSSIDPQLDPMCRGLPFTPGSIPKGLTKAVAEQVAQLGEGILFPTTDEHHHYAVDMHAKLVAAAEAIHGAGQSPTWIATEGERLVVVLRVPR